VEREIGERTMNVNGLGNLRPNADRTGDARRTERASDGSAERRAADAEPLDRLETGAAAVIDRSVAAARQTLRERLDAAHAARERLLALTSDPDAIRRAAQSLLDAV
jgi:hypothetical protein